MYFIEYDVTGSIPREFFYMQIGKKFILQGI